MIKIVKIAALLSVSLALGCGSVIDNQNDQGNGSSNNDPSSLLVTSVTVNPVFDTYVKQSAPTTSYASSATLSSDGSTTSGKQSYMEFNVMGVTGTITAVTLRLKVGSAANSGTGDQIVIKKIGSVLPTASRQLTGTYTWNAKPAVDSTVISNKTGGFVKNATVDFTIPTSVITGNGFYAFAVLNNSGSDKVDFLSMEGSTKPQLIITYNVVSTCAVPDVNLFGTTGITANTATPDWTAVSGANSYNVEYRVRNSGAAYSAPISTATNSTLLTSLQASTNYEFIVQSVCSGATSAFSASGWFTTLAGGTSTTCNVPAGLTASSITNTTAILNFSAATGAVSYGLQYRAVGASAWTAVSSSSTSKAISGLTAATNYEFQVQSVCSSSSSSFSGSANFTTTNTSGSTCTNMYSAGSNITPKNMWVWRDPIDVINSSTARATFFTFAEQQNVKTIYVNVRTMLEKYGTGSPESNTQTNLPIFLNTAASKCMDVQLLIGNGGSYVTSAEAAANFPTMTMLVQNAKQYVAGLSGTKPTAVHWDLEPHGLSDFKTGTDATKKAYIQRLINGFQKTRSILAGSGLKQAEDIPHWIDSAPYTAMTCDPNNNLSNPQYSLVAHQCLIRILDQVDIMDYRETASMTNPQAATEISYANTVVNFNGGTTKVVIGQETGDLGAADEGLTFYEELRGTACSNGFNGTKCMEKEFQAIQHNFNAAVGFAGQNLETAYNASNPASSFYLRPAEGEPAGISLHHYDSFNSSSVIFNFP